MYTRLGVSRVWGRRVIGNGMRRKGKKRGRGGKEEEKGYIGMGRRRRGEKGKDKKGEIGLERRRRGKREGSVVGGGRGGDRRRRGRRCWRTKRELRMNNEEKTRNIFLICFIFHIFFSPYSAILSRIYIRS